MLLWCFSFFLAIDVINVKKIIINANKRVTLVFFCFSCHRCNKRKKIIKNANKRVYHEKVINVNTLQVNLIQRVIVHCFQSGHAVYTPESIIVTFRRRNIASAVYSHWNHGPINSNSDRTQALAWLLFIIMLRFTPAIRQSFFYFT